MQRALRCLSAEVRDLTKSGVLNGVRGDGAGVEGVCVRHGRFEGDRDSAVTVVVVVARLLVVIYRKGLGDGRGVRGGPLRPRGRS